MFHGLSLPYLGKIELSAKKPSSNTLKGSLEQLTKSQLEFICKSYSEDTFANKEELVEYLYSAILTTCKHFFMYENQVVYDLMLMFLSNVGDDGGIVNAELSFPEDINNDQEAVIYLFNSGIAKNLIRHGYLFHHYLDDKEFYSIPIEVIREVLSEVDKEGKTPYGKWENFQDFSSCLISVYGVLTVNDFAKLWKIVFPEIALTEDQIIEHMSFSSVTSQEYKWYESLNAITEKFLIEAEAKDLIKERSRHSLYVPEPSVLKNWYEDHLNSQDEYVNNYFDQYEVEHNNPFYIQMRQFLEKVRKDDWAEILYYLMYYIKDGFMMTHAINYLNEDFNLTESMKEKEAEQFVRIYQQLHNSTHLWVNYGWSPNDLSTPKNPENIMNFQAISKVGRNDPCPCGTGKKYKKCHGR